MISQATIRPRIFTLILTTMAFAAVVLPTTALAQSAGGSSMALSASSSSSAALPDDPSAALSYTLYINGAVITRQQAREERTASLHMKYIPAGWKVLPLAPHDKVLLGFKDLYSPFSIGSIMVSAGYSHLTNDQPNYGTNGGAFERRVGASFLRDSTEGIFTDSVLAPLLHQDPRYYVEGPEFGLGHRTLYAITRPLMTRRDSGRPTPNYSLLLGYAGASALTYAYYPAINRNVRDTTATFGAGVGGAALGFAITEFTSGLLQKMHLAQR